MKAAQIRDPKTRALIRRVLTNWNRRGIDSKCRILGITHRAKLYTFDGFAITPGGGKGSTMPAERHDGTEWYDHKCWWAVYTRHQHEKIVARMRRDRHRMVLSVDLLAQSVAVRIEGADVGRVGGCSMNDPAAVKACGGPGRSSQSTIARFCREKKDVSVGEMPVRLR